MHRKKGGFDQKSGAKRPLVGLTPGAGRLVLTGLLPLMLGVCDVTARLYHGMIAGEIGLFLRMNGDIESLLASTAILVGGGLLLDYCERSTLGS